jgi:diacylglycerol kinase family enzyme
VVNLRQPVLFINPRSGGGRAGRARLPEAARDRGIDGSLSVVAAAAAAHGVPFVCIPAGTRNHFARDLGLDPEDLVGALDAFSDGWEVRIDLGDVNGRPFLNNVSLGVYGAAVGRESYRDAKAHTLVQTAADVLGPSAELPGVRVVDERGVAHTDPAVVLVSNNPYSAAAVRCGGRPDLARGPRFALPVVRAAGSSGPRG